MEKLSVIGLDLAKNVFQVHGANRAGKKVLSNQLKRGEVLEFFAKQPRCRVVKKGMVYSPSHADMAFTVPLFEGV